MANRLGGQRIAVTGASGFIGKRTVAALVGAGAEVTAILRNRHAAGAMRQLGATPVVSALDDRLNGILADHHAVCHLAYDVRASGPANVTAFAAVQAAAEASPTVQRIVHLSSIVVYEGWPNTDLDETSTIETAGGGPYRQAKIEMERRLMAGTSPSAILQPTIVYGPGSAIWTERFLDCLAQGGSIVLPDPEGICNAVYVDDVAAACVAALGVPDLGQERFIVSGPRPVAWSELFEGYAAMTGRGSVRFEPIDALRERLGSPEAEDGDTGGGPSAAARVSAALRKVIGNRRFEALVRQARRVMSGGGDFYPDHHLLDEFSGTGRCSIELATHRLGHRPAHDLAAGLAGIAAARGR